MIRLQRIGRKNDPSFRMLVLEKTASPKAGTYAAQVGTYNPKTKAFTVDMEAVKDWMSRGAQLSPSLSNLLIEKGLLEGKKVSVVKQKNLEKNKPAEEAVTPEAPAETPAEAPAETPAEEPAAAPAA